MPESPALGQPRTEPHGMSVAAELHGIAKLYGRTVALRGVTVRIGAGETLLLLGPNGSGKTTLLRIMARTIAPSAGEGSILGRDLREGPAVRSQLAFLSTDSYLYDDLTAYENLRFVATMAGLPVDIERLDSELEAVGLATQRDERVRAFSSGMKRRLALARVRLLEPSVLLLDEPYNSLDEPGMELVDALIRRVTTDGGTCVLATHDADRGLALADSVIVLRDGVVRFCGPVSDFRERHANRSD